jgi:hypothetical protein
VDDPSLSPAEIFKEEAMFPLVLKEASGRLLCSKAERMDGMRWDLWEAIKSDL